MGESPDIHGRLPGALPASKSPRIISSAYYMATAGWKVRRSIECASVWQCATEPLVTSPKHLINSSLRIAERHQGQAQAVVF
jgi:hypothetical protein